MDADLFLFGFVRRPEGPKGRVTGTAALIARSEESAWEILWRAPVETTDARAIELGSDGMKQECESAGWMIYSRGKARPGGFVMYRAGVRFDEGFTTPQVTEGDHG